MIIFEKLEWSNMFSYGANNSINFTSEPITQLIGLNGHGKSSVPLILEEVLFNKNSKGIKKGDIVNRNLDTNKFNATLTFKVFNDAYRIELSRTGATQKVKLLKNGSDISSHTATDTFKQIESIIGLDFKTFSQIVYQNSNSSLQFLTATDTARKNFLIELLSLERYVKIFEEVKKVHKGVADRLLTVQTKLDTIKAWIAKNTGKVDSYLVEKSSPVLDPIIIDRVSSLKSTLATIEATNKSIVKNNEYKKLLETIDKSQLAKQYEYIEYSQYSDKVAQINAAVASAQKTITSHKHIHEGTCSTCYQPIDISIINKIIEDAQKVITELSAEKDKLSIIIKEAKSNNSKLEEHQQLVEDFEKYSNLIDDSIPQLLLDKEEISSELAEVQSSLEAIRKEIDSVTKYNQSVVLHNAKVDSIKEQTQQFTKELEEHSKELEVVEEQMGLLEVLKKAFSTNGLLAYKIENSVKDLESLTNTYLAELSDGRFQLEFSLHNDKLNIVIIDNGKSIDITALSAGELARVTTSTLLAIRKLMSSLSKCRLNILFLDETIDNLDTFGKEKLVEVLLNEEYLNTFLISHGYTHPLISKLTVIKEEGVSRLEIG